MVSNLIFRNFYCSDMNPLEAAPHLKTYIQIVSECGCWPCRRKIGSSGELFNSVDFYVGRLIRILPIYYLCLIAGNILVPLGFLIDSNSTITIKDYCNFGCGYSKWGWSHTNFKDWPARKKCKK